MEQLSIASLSKDLKFEGFLLARTSEQRQGSNGGKYLDMTLCDRTGEINAKMWDGQTPAPPAGSVLKVRALVTEFAGKLQLRVDKLRSVVPEDGVDMSVLVPCAPWPPEEMKDEILAAAAAIADENLRAVMLELISATGEQLMYYPAAQKLHHAERAGLLHHTVSMLRAANALLPVYPQLDGDLVRAGVIAHDLAKITELRSDEAGNVSDYTPRGQLLGHLVRGVCDVRDAARRAGVSDEDEYVMLLEHLIISHHGEAEFGSPRPPMFPEAEMLHTLDVLDARMFEMDTVMRRVPEGACSEKLWSLDRRLYHPRYRKNGAPFKAEPPKANPAEPIAPQRTARRENARADSEREYQRLL